MVDPRMFRRFVVNLAAGGARHPVGAAVAVVARASSQHGVVEFAESAGVEVPWLRAAEAGEVSTAAVVARLFDVAASAVGVAPSVASLVAESGPVVLRCNAAGVGGGLS